MGGDKRGRHDAWLSWLLGRGHLVRLCGSGRAADGRREEARGRGGGGGATRGGRGAGEGDVRLLQLLWRGGGGGASPRLRSTECCASIARAERARNGRAERSPSHTRAARVARRSAHAAVKRLLREAAREGRPRGANGVRAAHEQRTSNARARNGVRGASEQRLKGERAAAELRPSGV